MPPLTYVEHADINILTAVDQISQHQLIRRVGKIWPYIDRQSHGHGRPSKW